MNILLLNGGKAFGHSHGELSKRSFDRTWTQCKRNCD